MDLYWFEDEFYKNNYLYGNMKIFQLLITNMTYNGYNIPFPTNSKIAPVKTKRCADTFSGHKLVSCADIITKTNTQFFKMNRTLNQKLTVSIMNEYLLKLELFSFI